MVFILGSIHLGDPGLYPLADTIEQAFDLSDILVVEFDVSKVDESHAARLMLQKARYAEGETLYDNIPEALYRKADSVLEEMGADILLFNTYEPWAVAMQIEAIELIQYGYVPEYGIDMYFLARAHQNSKEVYELESAEFQMNVLDRLPEGLQIFMLENVVNDRLTKKSLEQMFDIWKAGDVNAMERLVFEDAEENPELRAFNEKMLDERNYAMAEKITGFLEDDKTYFVVVGAGHLVGDNGLIRLLQDAGYQATHM